jgi:hypothetical protein
LRQPSRWRQRLKTLKSCSPFFRPWLRFRFERSSSWDRCTPSWNAMPLVTALSDVNKITGTDCVSGCVSGGQCLSQSVGA